MIEARILATNSEAAFAARLDKIRARVALKRLMNARYGVVDRITFDESVHGDEVVEGFTAFIEKRTPAWVPEAARREGRA